MLEIFIVLNEKKMEKDQGRGKTYNSGKRRGGETTSFFFNKEKR